jgi:hypothetical protein
MEARELALWHARGRQLLGAAFVLAPGLAGRAWIGSDARRRPVKVLARAFGARDLAIGLGAVIALAGSSIPRAIRWPSVALGAGSAALGALLAPQVAEQQAPIPGETPESALTGHPAQR